MQELPRRLSTNGLLDCKEGKMNTGEQEHRIAVIGGGVMGTNIATLALGYGFPVVLVDVDSATLDRARSAIAGKLRHAQLMGALPRDGGPGELVASTNLRAAADAKAVIEAVT